MEAKTVVCNSDRNMTLSRYAACGAMLFTCAVAAFAQQPLTLQQLEDRALQANPLLAESAAAVRAAAGKTTQAGLYPNPRVGAMGSNIANNAVIRGGDYGAFAEQRIVTAGKLGLARRLAAHDETLANLAVEANRQRVRNAIRSLYYQALGEQKLAEVETRLAQLAQQVKQVSGELKNVGAADEPDVLAADVEAQRLELGLETVRNARERTWRQIAAVVNDPALTVQPLAGDLEALPKLQMDQALARLLAESPDVKTGDALAQRAELSLRRQKALRVPDVTIGGGVSYNRELLDVDQPVALRPPIGTTGFFDVSVELPIFNRNQGAIAAAAADSEVAKLDLDRTKLALRARLAESFRAYNDAVAVTDRYRTRMIPEARRAYQLYLANFHNMAAAYPQVLITERNLFQLQEGYIRALVTAWRSVVEIQGMLLNPGLGLGQSAMQPDLSLAAAQ